MFHYVWRADGHLTAALDSEQRLRAIRALLAVRVQVLTFCVVDNHVHALLETATPRIRSALSRALAVATGRPGEPSRIRPVESRSHLENTVRYHLNQSAHHDLSDPPARYDGSCFPDLIGARVLAGFDPTRLGTRLPRRGHVWLWDAVGLPVLAPATANGYPLSALVAAARAATGATGHGNAGHEVLARAIAARVGRRTAFSCTAIGEALGVDPRTVRRWAAAAPTPWEKKAVELQLALRASPAARR